ncbi:Tryptophan/tyrosine permease [Macleaya cordata]|uniref:Tryptophan/tyrosine permease n=1 Tax=Macleaya cordata TaxID=56857 RepID=A0A200QHZ6_MACCD|nr:Tryptophan/tyrosine permease [Macleaya cordata]
MEIEMQLMSCSHGRDRKHGTSLFWAPNHKHDATAISFRESESICMLNYSGCNINDLHQRKISSVRPDQNFFRTRASKNTKQSTDGFIPSSVSMILCWGFLLIEALLLAEINVGLLRKKMKRESEELEVISIRTMAQETLGDWGGTLATVIYLFLGYTTMVAYTSKSGAIIHNMINIPSSISGFFFTALFTILISVGGTRTTDQVNQWLTVTMIGILVAIEVLAVLYGGWSGLDGSSNWGNVPATLPVIIFSLVYHDLSPVICAYLDGDLARIRASLVIGSLVPLLALLVWDAVALGLSAHSDQVVDPLDLLMRVRWSGVSAMVEAFSLLAVGTSLIGTLLGFSQFFLEQLNYFSSNSPSTQTLSRLIGFKKWWGSNKLSFTATAMAVAPALFISTTVPDAFSAATDIAGGYCMTMLYGVLPPAMAWAMHTRTRSSKNGGINDDENSEEDDGLIMELSRVKPALIGVGLFSCGIVIDQIFEDLSLLHP